MDEKNSMHKMHYSRQNEHIFKFFSKQISLRNLYMGEIDLVRIGLLSPPSYNQTYMHTKNGESRAS